MDNLGFNEYLDSSNMKAVKALMEEYGYQLGLKTEEQHWQEVYEIRQAWSDGYGVDYDYNEPAPAPSSIDDL